jgi:hypothetical protein
LPRASSEQEFAPQSLAFPAAQRRGLVEGSEGRKNGRPVIATHWRRFQQNSYCGATVEPDIYPNAWRVSGVEIEDVLSAALAHPKASAMEITILNPKLDTDGKGLF